MLCVSTLCSICPYYTARALSKTADFVLMPYNYILSPRVVNCICVSVCLSVSLCLSMSQCMCVCVCVCVCVCLM